MSEDFGDKLMAWFRKMQEESAEMRYRDADRWVGKTADWPRTLPRAERRCENCTYMSESGGHCWRHTYPVAVGPLYFCGDHETEAEYNERKAKR